MKRITFWGAITFWLLYPATALALALSGSGSDSYCIWLCSWQLAALIVSVVGMGGCAALNHRLVVSEREELSR